MTCERAVIKTVEGSIPLTILGLVQLLIAQRQPDVRFGFHSQARFTYLAICNYRKTKSPTNQSLPYGVVH